MPVGAFVPSRIHLDYPEWQAPLIGNVGQVWAYDGTGYVPTSFLLASAVSVYGLTLASAADAAAARTALALGTAATLNVGTSANNVVQLDGTGKLPAVDGSQLTGISGGSGSPGGSTTQVQYNNAGAFAGDAGLTYNASTDRLTVAGGLVAPSMRPASDSTTALQLQNAAGTAVVTVDTTQGRLGINCTPVFTFEVRGNSAGLFIDRTGEAAFILISQDETFGGQIRGIKDQQGLRFTNRSSTTEYMRLVSGVMGIGVNDPVALLDLAASTTARASLRMRAGTAPTTPNAGDIYFNGTNFFGYNGSAWKQLDN